MGRSLPILALVATHLFATGEVCARPPDQVKYSPVPPLQERTQRSATRASYVEPATKSSGGGVVKLPLPLSSSARRPIDLRDSTMRRSQPLSTAGDRVESQVDGDAVREEIWNSDEMKVARQAVLEFCRRSAQTTEEEGKRFLKALYQLPSDEMKRWLERYIERRNRFQRGREIEQQARQLKLEETFRRHEDFRSGAYSGAELRNQMAAARAASAQQPATMPGFGSSQLNSIIYGPSYNPFEVVFDPVSPRGYRRRVAAAMSLPGDLPRDDPRNFIRGDVPIEGEETPPTPLVVAPPVVSAPSPSPAPAPTPVGPVNEAADGQ